MSQALPWLNAAPTPAAAPQAAPVAPPAAAPAPWRAAAAQGAPAQQPAALPPSAAGFDAVGDAETFEKGVYFPIGIEAIVEVEEFKALTSRNPKTMGHSKLIVKGKILESNSPLAPPGMVASQSINVSNFGGADAQRLLAACVGVSSKEGIEQLKAQGMFTGAAILQICSPAQPLRGKKLLLKTYTKTKVKTGVNPDGTPYAVNKTFPQNDWSPYTG